MAYISTEEVKQIRDRIKKEFPKYKFSISCANKMSVIVKILKADLDPINNDGNSYVNIFYIERMWSNNPETMKVLLKINEIINSVKKCEDRNAGDLSADYADFNFFYEIGFGTWNKEYERV